MPAGAGDAVLAGGSLALRPRTPLACAAGARGPFPGRSPLAGAGLLEAEDACFAAWAPSRLLSREAATEAADSTEPTEPCCGAVC